MFTRCYVLYVLVLKDILCELANLLNGVCKIVGELVLLYGFRMVYEFL